MTQMPRLLAAIAAPLLLASAALAAGDTWIGRDPDDPRLRYTVTRVAGDTWKLRCNGKDFGNFEAVAKNATYTELKYIKGDERIRLYSDRMEMNVEGSRFRFSLQAKGKFSE